MNRFGASVFVALLGTTAMAYGDSFVIDNFTCFDSVSTAGTAFASSVISCPGSIGGTRGDSLFFTGGSSSAGSTINSNPPAGAITGTIGSGLTGVVVMAWFGTTTPGVFNLPNLNLAGYSILVQIESTTGGTLNVNLGSGSVGSSNLLSYSALFPASASFVDVLIPLTNPTVLGTGANINDVTAIGLQVRVPGGGTFTIDSVQAVVPEPSTFGFLGVGIAVLGFWKRRALGFTSE